eukprot:5986-Prorocentrum_minimum.AAC.6
MVSRTNHSKRSRGVNVGAVCVEGEGLLFWEGLPADVRDVIAPCLTSKYQLKDRAAHARSSYKAPIFANARHLSFRKWLFTWSRQLLSQAGGPRAEVRKIS